MSEDNGASRSPLRLIFTFLAVLVLPLAVGLYSAPRVVPKPQVGIIRLSTEIAIDSTFEVTEQLAYARENSAVQAVVVVINSPGGSAAASEELYFEVLNTRAADVPVVASIDLLAASGGYFMAAAADEIYAKPTSIVGSIGVIATLPGEVFLEEDQFTSGPFKAFGGTRDAFMRDGERAKFAFLEAVVTGRAERLQVDTEFLSRAEIYTGVESLDFGLVDRLGSTDEAVQRAAVLAGLSAYDVVELFPLTFPEGSDFTFGRYQPAPVDVEKLWAPPSNLAPGLYYRYIPLP